MRYIAIYQQHSTFDSFRLQLSSLVPMKASVILGLTSLEAFWSGQNSAVARKAFFGSSFARLTWERRWVSRTVGDQYQLQWILNIFARLEIAPVDCGLASRGRSWLTRARFLRIRVWSWRAAVGRTPIVTPTRGPSTEFSAVDNQLPDAGIMNASENSLSHLPEDLLPLFLPWSLHKSNHFNFLYFTFGLCVHALLMAQFFTT